MKEKEENHDERMAYCRCAVMYISNSLPAVWKGFLGSPALDPSEDRLPLLILPPPVKALTAPPCFSKNPPVLPLLEECFLPLLPELFLV